MERGAESDARGRELKALHNTAREADAAKKAFEALNKSEAEVRRQLEVRYIHCFRYFFLAFVIPNPKL